MTVYVVHIKLLLYNVECFSQMKIKCVFVYSGDIHLYCIKALPYNLDFIHGS